jgi:Holliday junction resolvasome RuvABC ATP-dependent DNA helicase subunit
MRDIEEFTLIIASNRVGELNRAFRSRFHPLHLDEYSLPELTEIARRVATAENMGLTPQAARCLAEESLSPRVIEMRVRHLGLFFPGSAEVTQPMVDRYLRVAEGLDEFGLTAMHRRCLHVLDNQNGHPMAQRTLAVALGTDLGTVANDVEPELARRGLLAFASRGRYLTANGRAMAREAARSTAASNDDGGAQ